MYISHSHILSPSRPLRLLPQTYTPANTCVMFRTRVHPHASAHTHTRARTHARTCTHTNTHTQVARGRSALLGRYLSRRCFTLCMTVELEPRIAKQYKCQYCCSCKNYRGKGMEGGKKVSLPRFFPDQKIASS